MLILLSQLIAGYRGFGLAAFYNSRTNSQDHFKLSW